MSRRIPPQLRRQVWETYMIKPTLVEGPCFVCRNNIHILNFECGHVESYQEGGPTVLDNLRPICSSCNRSMGTTNLFEYQKRYFGKPDLSGKSNSSSKSDGLVKSSKSNLPDKPGKPDKPDKSGLPMDTPIKSDKSIFPAAITNLLPSLPAIQSVQLSQPAKKKPKKQTSGLMDLISGIASWSLGSSGGCQHVMQKGPRKGQKCTDNLWSGQYCRKHAMKH